MLGRIVLIVLQIVIAWIGGHIIAGYIPVSAQLGLFFFAAIFAALIYLTGVLGSQVLRGTGTPSTAALTSSFVVALIVAAVLTFGRDFIPPLPDWFSSRDAWVLAGAMLGYLIRR